MNVEELRDFCLSQSAVTESFPFGDTVLVFKVVGKMFALVSLDRVPFTVALKCDPEYAEELREQYEEITPGFHLNKKHWNDVLFEGSLRHDFLISLVQHSYDMVVKGLKKADRDALNSEN